MVIELSGVQFGVNWFYTYVILKLDELDLKSQAWLQTKIFTTRSSIAK